MNKKTLFKKSSTTYYYSSLFFPQVVLNEVSALYAYVRTADNFVDQIPQNIQGYKQFIHTTNILFNNQEIPVTDQYTTIITEFVQLAKRYHFKKKWINAFHLSMIKDIQRHSGFLNYYSRAELNRYIYGSAEIIGLCMARILQLPKKSYKAAQLQGYAMQHINFIRDIREDCSLKRHYLPIDELKQFSILHLCLSNPEIHHKKNFSTFIRKEIKRYEHIQKKAELGYRYIPYRYRIPIATAAALYKWTAQEIYKNPLIVFKKKIKPNKYRVLYTFFKQAFLWI